MVGLVSSSKRRDLFFYVLFIVSIFIDSINGFLQVSYNIYTPIGMAFRGVILLYVCYYKSFSQKTCLTALFGVVVISYFLSILIWISSSNYFSLVEEFNALFRFLYFWGVIFYFQKYRILIDKEKLFSILMKSIFIIAAMNILCFTFGWGNNSYGENFGFGTKAFYADGNSIGMYLVLSQFYVLGNFVNSKTNKIRWMFYYMVVVVGTILIGSRTAFIGTVIIFLVVLLYRFFCMPVNQSNNIKRLLIVCLLALSVFIFRFAINKIISYDSFTSERYTVESMSSPREKLIEEGLSVISSYEGLELIIGNGKSSGLREMGIKYLDSSDGDKSIEADFYDQILFYGWGLGGLFCFMYLSLSFYFIANWIKERSESNFLIMCLSCVWIMLSAIGGHGFGNVMIAPLLGCGFVFATKNKLVKNGNKRSF